MRDECCLAGETSAKIPALIEGRAEMLARLGNNNEKQTFYQISPDFGRIRRGIGIEIENLGKITRGNSLTAGPGRWGVPDYSEPPLFRLDSTRGRPLRDLELYHAFWLISEPAKIYFSELDPEAFSFLECTVITNAREPGPRHWLCDVTRVIPGVIDEEKSNVTPKPSRVGILYDIPPARAKVVMRPEVVGAAHFFRISYFNREAFCDQQAKDKCKLMGLKGIRFRNLTGEM